MIPSGSKSLYVHGVSTRSVEDLVKAMGASGVSKSQVSRLVAEIDERVNAFLTRPIEGEWPYLWIDATYLKVREGGRIVSTAAIIAVGVNTDGRREVLGVGGRTNGRTQNGSHRFIGLCRTPVRPVRHTAVFTSQVGPRRDRTGYAANG